MTAAIFAAASADVPGILFILILVMVGGLSYGFGTRCRAQGGCHKLFGEIRSGRFESSKPKIECFEQWREETTKTLIREDAHASPWDVGEWQGRRREQLLEKVKYEVVKTTRYQAIRCRCRHCAKEWELVLAPEVDENWRRIGPA